jgi:hypothetical protein
MADQPVTKSDLDALEMRLLERIERSETRLLSEFRKWVVPFTALNRVFEATGIGRTDRVSMLEERIDGLEQK